MRQSKRSPLGGRHLLALSLQLLALPGAAWASPSLVLVPQEFYLGNGTDRRACVSANFDHTTYCCEPDPTQGAMDVSGFSTSFFQVSCTAIGGRIQAVDGGKSRCSGTAQVGMITPVEFKGLEYTCVIPDAHCDPKTNPGAPDFLTAPSVTVTPEGEVHKPKQFFSTGYLPRNDSMEGGHWGAYHVKDPEYPGYYSANNSRKEKVAPVFSLYEYLNADDVQSCPRFAECKNPARFNPTYVSTAVSKYIKLGSVLRIPDVEQYVRDHFFGAPAKGKVKAIPATPEQFVVLPGEKFPTPFLRKHPEYLVVKENFEERVKVQIQKITARLKGAIPFVANDVGGAINGAHVDICTGDRQFNMTRYPVTDKSLGVRKGRRPNTDFTEMGIITTQKRRELNLVPSVVLSGTTYSSRDYFEKILLRDARTQVGTGEPLIVPTEPPEGAHRSRHRKKKSK